MLSCLELIPNLPNAESSFASLHAGQRIHADKTQYVLQTAEDSVPKILTSPRRFGTSALLSTLKDFFMHSLKPYDGHDSYFKELYIEREWSDEGQYQVLDFADLYHEAKSIAGFKERLCRDLDRYAEQFDIEMPDYQIFPSEKLRTISEGAAKRLLVLLIDEHGAPVLAHVNDQAECEAAQYIFKGLNGMVKSYSEKLRRVFITGTARCRDLGLGSAGAVIKDIFLSPDFGCSCCFTKDELLQYFKEPVSYAASAWFKTGNEPAGKDQIISLLDLMAKWHGGNCFDEDGVSRVFSPWPELCFLAERQPNFKACWVIDESLGPLQLIKSLADKLDLPALLQEAQSDRFEVSVLQFYHSAPANDRLNALSLLYQAGNLTLRGALAENGCFYLTAPNRETGQAFAYLISARLYGKEEFFSLKETLTTLRALLSLDPETIAAHFSQQFAQLSYHDYPVNSESAVRALVQFMLSGAQIDVRSEVVESRGRADLLVVNLPEHGLMLIFEFKFEKSSDPQKQDPKLAAAAAQLKARDYGRNVHAQKILARFALVFCADKVERRFVRWQLVGKITRSLG